MHTVRFVEDEAQVRALVEAQMRSEARRLSRVPGDRVLPVLLVIVAVLMVAFVVSAVA